MNEINQPYLSVIIPAYNEEGRIGNTLGKIKDYLSRQNYTHEVIVSNDASTDITPKIIKIMQENWPQLKIIHAHKNSGKGAAVRQGMLAAQGCFLLFMDADGSTPIQEIEKLWTYTQDFPIVVGSRHCSGATIHIKQAPHRILLSRMSNILIRIMVAPGMNDTQCGFKLFEKNAGQNIFAKMTIDRWGFDFEALMIARRLNYKIKEIGVEWSDDSASKFASREALRTLFDLFYVKWRMIRGAYDRIGYIKQTPIIEPTEKKELTQIEK